MLINTLHWTNNIFGSKKDIENLSKKDSARLLVVSDCHGSSDILESIIRQFGKECDALLFCGDGIVDLLNIIICAKKDRQLRSLIPSVIAFVRGNCDPDTYPISRNRTIKLPEKQVLCVNHQNIMIVHGHREGVDFGMENLAFEMQLSDCKTAFYGHTHIAKENKLDDYTIINPGSCARPRGGQPESFAIITVGNNFIDTGYLKIDSDLNGNNSFSHWTPIY